MFCYQCEQTAQGTGCRKIGVCGKDAETAGLQDLLIYAAKGISMYAHRARQSGVADHSIDMFIIEALFSTITNVNFDTERFVELLGKAGKTLDKTRGLYEEACKKASQEPESLEGPAQWKPASDKNGLLAGRGNQYRQTYRIAWSRCNRAAGIDHLRS